MHPCPCAHAPLTSGERWLDIRARRVKRVMARRLAFAAEIGCDGVDPDNVNGYAADTGFPLTKQVGRWRREEYSAKRQLAQSSLRGANCASSLAAPEQSGARGWRGKKICCCLLSESKHLAPS